jgi:hypothetical protein
MVRKELCKKTAYPFRATSLRICCYGRSIPCLTARIKKPTVRSPIKNLTQEEGGKQVKNIPMLLALVY